MRKEQAAMRKAEWLAYCLEMGWQKKHLDELSALWDKYKDEYGGFRPLLKVELNPERSVATGMPKEQNDDNQTP